MPGSLLTLTLSIPSLFQMTSHPLVGHPLDLDPVVSSPFPQQEVNTHTVYSEAVDH